MSNASEFSKLLTQCRALASQKRYKEALAIAQKLLAMDAENIALHKLLALLYGLNNDHLKAHQHYLLLVQFDESYTVENCLLLAECYAEKKLYLAAALICKFAAKRLPDKRLFQFAVECFEKAGEKEEAERLKKQI